MQSAVDYLVYLLLRAAWAVAERTPLPILRSFLEGAGRLAMRLDARHRAVVAENLAQAFPEWDDARRADVTAAAFAGWGRIVAELAHLDSLASPETLADLEVLRAAVDRLHEQGRGVLVLTAHTGNFEALARLWGRTGHTLMIFHRGMSNLYAERWFVEQRRASNVIDPGRGGSVREILRELAANGQVAAPLDQNQAIGRGIFVDFFGRKASTSTLLARLALSSGAAVLPVFALWEGARLKVEVGEPIETPHEVGRGEARARAIREMTQRYTTEIENVVRRHPEQWNWAHRRWKTRPPDECARGGEIRRKEISAANPGDNGDAGSRAEIRGNSSRSTE